MNRIQQLVSTNQRLFHTQDLSRAWGIDNLNTLYTTISRYTSGSSPLFPIQKGLYSLVNPQQLDPKYLVQTGMPYYTYISTETVLAEHGAISQKLEYMTLVGEQSKRGKLLSHNYRIRQLKDDYLFNNLGVEQHQDYKQASLSRAQADLHYFNPYYYLDNPAVIDWDEVKDIYQKVYSRNYDHA